MPLLSAEKVSSPFLVSEKTPMKRQRKPAPVYASPHQFVCIVRQLMQVDGNQRESDRVPKRLSLSVQPLTEKFETAGDPYWAISSDFSNRGMGFISDDAMVHDYVRIKLLEEELSVVAKVCHSTSIGTLYPLYLVGVEFLDGYRAV